MPLLHEYVVRNAALHPGKEALADGACRLSYGELEAQASQLAHCLQAHGIGRGSSVLLCMRRSVQYLVAMLGVSKADAVYVPIEARTPATRRTQIIKDCQPQAVICDAETVKVMLADEELTRLNAAIILLDPAEESLPISGRPFSAREEIATMDSTAPAWSNSPDDLACLLYTSGSTGSPKGVMFSHRNISEYAKWGVERIGIIATDRILGTAPFYFDMSLFDIYCSLHAGATLCIASERVLLFPKSLLQFAESEHVTVWKGVSSLLMYLAQTEALSPERLPTLRVVLFGGETLATKFLIQWMQTFPNKVFYNAYGPTEATGVSVYYRVPRLPASAHEKIPIGIPCENTELYLLDEQRKLVSPGEIGEIALGGVCISKGYLHDPEKTRKVFIDNPVNPGQAARIYLTGDYAQQQPDGNYQYLGRKDNQIKFMGYRLELTDIENALVAIEGVKDAGVLLAASSRSNVDELIGYVELDGKKSVTEVLAELKRRLPFYMLPRHLYEIDQFPRSDRGKLDRQALKAYHQEKNAST